MHVKERVEKGSLNRKTFFSKLEVPMVLFAYVVIVAIAVVLLVQPLFAQWTLEGSYCDSDATWVFVHSKWGKLATAQQVVFNADNYYNTISVSGYLNMTQKFEPQMVIVKAYDKSDTRNLVGEINIPVIQEVTQGGNMKFGSLGTLKKKCRDYYYKIYLKY